MAGVVQNLVVDIGDVANVRDVVAAGSQPSPDDVESHSTANVPHVRRPLDGGAAYVHAHPTGFDRGELTDRSSGRVMQAKYHGETVAVRPTE